MRLSEAEIEAVRTDRGDFLASAYGPAHVFTAHVHMSESGETTGASFSWTEHDQTGERGRDRIECGCHGGRGPRTTVMVRWAQCQPQFRGSPSADEVNELLFRLEGAAQEAAKRWREERTAHA